MFYIPCKIWNHIPHRIKIYHTSQHTFCMWLQCVKHECWWYLQQIVLKSFVFNYHTATFSPGSDTVLNFQLGLCAGRLDYSVAQDVVLYSSERSEYKYHPINLDVRIPDDGKIYLPSFEKSTYLTYSNFNYPLGKSVNHLEPCIALVTHWSISIN